MYRKCLKNDIILANGIFDLIILFCGNNSVYLNGYNEIRGIGLYAITTGKELHMLYSNNCLFKFINFTIKCCIMVCGKYYKGQLGNYDTQAHSIPQPIKYLISNKLKI